MLKWSFMGARLCPCQKLLHNTSTGHIDWNLDCQHHVEPLQLCQSLCQSLQQRQICCPKMGFNGFKAPNMLVEAIDDCIYPIQLNETFYLLQIISYISCGTS